MVVRRLSRGPSDRVPELVWIHGLGERSTCFDAIAGHRLLDGMIHVLPDLPGYGAGLITLAPDGALIIGNDGGVYNMTSLWRLSPATGRPPWYDARRR